MSNSIHQILSKLGGKTPNAVGRNVEPAEPAEFVEFTITPSNQDKVSGQPVKHEAMRDLMQKCFIQKDRFDNTP